MRTLRFLWPPNVPLDETREFSLAPDHAACHAEIFLAPDQARHALLVLRLEAGARVELLSAAGLAPAMVSTAEGGANPRLGLRLTGPWLANEAARGPCLAMALIQNARFDWVVEKSVELGAAGLIPLITERVKSGDGRPGEAKMSRWQRLAEEARKQCGRSSPLEIQAPMTLAELTALERPGPAFFFSPAAGPEDIVSAEGGPAPLLVIGPEGGFSPAEEKLMLAAAFTPKSLGPLTLRAETAALAALARLL